jgi:hypothetical protein
VDKQFGKDVELRKSDQSKAPSSAHIHYEQKLQSKYPVDSNPGLY